MVFSCVNVGPSHHSHVNNTANEQPYSGYINQKILECLRDLIGEESPENDVRLKSAALRATTGVQPTTLQLLSNETRQHFEVLREGMLSSGNFATMKEHLVAYIMYSQRDEGRRKKL